MWLSLGSVFGKWLFASLRKLVKLWQFQLCWREGSAGKMEECILKMIRDSLSRCSALLSKCLDINISLGKYCAQDIFYFVWSALVTFMSAAEGQRRWVRAAGKPDHKISQKITKGNPIFFSQGMFRYGSRFVEELKSLLETTKEYTTKTIRSKQDVGWNADGCRIWSTFWE